MMRTLRSVVRFRRFEPNRARRRLARAASVADLRELARRRLPAGIRVYRRAAEGELAIERNAAAFIQPSLLKLRRVYKGALSGSSRRSWDRGDLRVRH